MLSCDEWEAAVEPPNVEEPSVEIVFQNVLRGSFFSFAEPLNSRQVPVVPPPAEEESVVSKAQTDYNHRGAVLSECSTRLTQASWSGTSLSSRSARSSAPPLE